MKQVLINLAVKDLQKSMDFYTAAGFTTHFADETPKRMVWSEHISIMIMTHEKFTGITNKPVAETETTVSTFFSLTVNSIGELHNFITQGLNAGGTEVGEMDDYGFMQQRTIVDPDGYAWS